MCVAIPARVLSVTSEGPSIKGVVEYSTGDSADVELAMLPDVAVGDHVIVHSGFAIRKVPANVADLDNGDSG